MLNVIFEEYVDQGTLSAIHYYSIKKTYYETYWCISININMNINS
jgi:general stress protein CsbA